MHREMTGTISCATVLTIAEVSGINTLYCSSVPGLATRSVIAKPVTYTTGVVPQ